ncbi:hypothetical protein N7509_010227 [Penicillium cosmopolitanum]|uniref:Zn(2)-C6 fungal-type domain-containing protein n=1 Tax=Penicillium cosmopolitanum TaxID=1131564 RepID=A0A9W9VQX6_9EURO|nr:uncharacterized protein N7509_010227 [Penicillium cosmopolitanum]KAJ5387686.1 hypothetical protein N7509_010227 [Penicillium cosmopolitanum]
MMAVEGLQSITRQRAANPKVRTGCITCKARHVKCDEGKPVCLRYACFPVLCTSLVILDSKTLYTSTNHTNLQVLAHEPAVAPAVDSTTEHALEVFFLCTAPALAGYFEHAFFQGSVLQFSLGEPAILQAIAALGSLHEQAAASKIQHLHRKTSLPELPLKLYNRAIRVMIEKVTVDPTNLPLIAMVNILFICFEYFQGNLQAAASHIRGGIDILNNWRAKNIIKRDETGGHRYVSSEAEFMETEVAPLLCTFNINAVQWGVGVQASVVPDPPTDSSTISMPDRFDTLKAARAALLKLVISATWEFEPSEKELSNTDFPLICERIMTSLNRWKVSFEDLVNRQSHLWDNRKRQTADAIIVMHANAELGVYSYQAQSHCDWDKYRDQYEVTAALINKLIADTNHFPHELSRTFSLDFRMMFPLQPVAWRCRWPHLHRVGLDLRARLPDLNSLPAAKQYHTVSARIAEIEEAYRNMPAAKGDFPEMLNIQDYSIVISQGEQDQPPAFVVTFWSKPDGLEGSWYSFTENIQLESGGAGNACLQIRDREDIQKVSDLISDTYQEDSKPSPSSLKSAAMYPCPHISKPIKEERPGPF